MGWKPKLPKIKPPSVIKDAVKNVTNLAKYTNPTGLAAAAAGLFGGSKGKGGGGGPVVSSTGGIEALSAKYEKDLARQRLKNVEIGGQLTESLRKQAMGEAPSLAEAQLKSAQTRNLAQTLAAAQSAGASPLSTRQMLQMRGQQGRELAETGTQMALQERQAAQAALGGQLASQAGIVRSDIESGFGIGRVPYQMAQEKDIETMRAQAAKDAAKQQRIGQERAAAAQAIGSIATAAVQQPASSDVNGKKNIKPAKNKVQSFLDALEAREYEYKDTSLPGTAEGTRYGIMAQDLEKSSMGKTLVKNTKNGKVVDTVQGFGAVLAAQAELNRRLKKLEKKGK